MIHPIDNQYHYGTVYNLDGKIVGFNLSPDVFIGLTDEEIERVLGAYAKLKHEQDEFIAKSINQLLNKTDKQKEDD